MSVHPGAVGSVVKVWSEPVVLPTYMPAPPDRNPMFLEKRVYQGSSGKVYPLPFYDRIEEKPIDRSWQAIHLENEFLRVLILPELGGRIHAVQDKSNGYDLIYRQDVIKPALVGLTGPWISGGIEFNWPQHHRPATFLPVDVEIEEHADGSKTVWCSDHDPMTRMKGMHGVCLHPDRSSLELKVRAYNRTQFVQTFLWWANVATKVHEGYQSFFPPDVHYVADHARRSMSSYPLAEGFYYGVNYGERGRNGIPQTEIPSHFVPPHVRNNSDSTGIPNYRPNDLSYYANIPTPCSYMCMGSKEDFFGGYDYKAQAGIVHVANHHISPGKKQWTWGNHDFGYAWDRNLTETDSNGEYAPYIEIMAGVYTDNQPDFSFLQPGETKTWSQFWYPIKQIGPATHANVDAAVSLRMDRAINIGVCVTRPFANARIVLYHGETELLQENVDLTPNAGWTKVLPLPVRMKLNNLQLRVIDADGREIISYQPKLKRSAAVPPPATEPPSPETIGSSDELFITGLHLEQYRHATRCPTLYWREALRRDASDSRCNNAMGLWHLRRGEFEVAERHFLAAIARLTLRNANPYDGEAHYNLGLCLRYLSESKPKEQSELLERAYAAFYKSTWNQSWAAAGYHALAEMDCRRGDWAAAIAHLDHSLRFNTDNLAARNLKVMVLQKLGRDESAEQVLTESLSLDPLDWWGRYLRGDSLLCDSQVKLDLAHDLARAGFYGDAIQILNLQVTESDWADQSQGAAPLVQYTLAWLYRRAGDNEQSKAALDRAANVPTDYCFPSRLEEILVLQSAIDANRYDSRAPFYLGCLLYDRRRHKEAIALWERSAKIDPTNSVVWRNLGIGYFNILNQPAKAKTAYQKAIAANPTDGRLLYERDQLWKRLGESPTKRLGQMEKHRGLVDQRDDLSIELCALLNQVGRHEDALEVLTSRHFQPWEGGEGGPLGQHVRTHLMLGRRALAKDDAKGAMEHFHIALNSPDNLGEARHLLANQSDVHYWLGVALAAGGDANSAKQHWKLAAEFKGDFQQMSVRSFSEMTYYSALSMQRLGQKAQAGKLLKHLQKYATNLANSPATMDYFATSLPTMLLFDDDLQFRQTTTALFLQAQAQLGLGQRAKAKALLKQVLRRDPNHALAADLANELSHREKP